MDSHGRGSEESSRVLSTSTIDKESGSNYTTISSDAAPVIETPVDESAAPLNEFHGHKAMALKDQLEEQPADDDLPEYEWDEHPARELEVVLNNNMLAIVETAINKVVECGYSKVAAAWAVLHAGLSRGSKDVLSNIVDGALEMLKTEKECNIPNKHVFDGIKRMSEYLVLEMTNVILETRPDFTTKEAMYCLLKNDMNLSTACPAAAEDGASQTSHSGDDKKPMADSTPHPPKSRTYPGTKWDKVSVSVEEMRCNLRVAREHIRLVAAQAGATMNEKAGASKKSKSKAKIGVLGKAMLEKTLKSQSHLLAKIAEAKANASTSPAPVSASASVKAKSNPPQDPRLKGKTKVVEPVRETPDYYAGIPYDETLEKHIPRDEKERHILTLVPLTQELEKKLQYWSDWAKEKVVQATTRLAQEQGELKKLRKEKQAMKDSASKRILEIETALSKANKQMEVTNAYFLKLQEENSRLKTRMGVSNLRATQSFQLLEDAVEREKEAIRKCQSLETEKGLFLDQLESSKNEIAELNCNQLGKMNESRLRFEGLLRKEEREKAKAIGSLEYLQSKKEEDEGVASAEAESIAQMAETNIKETRDEIKNLERRISELRQRSRIGDMIFTFRGLQQPTTTTCSEGRARARECVMCMHEETAVVFLPCAHQVLCLECNGLHQRQPGMNDCPSCRATIQRRIPVRFRDRV